MRAGSMVGEMAASKVGTMGATKAAMRAGWKVDCGNIHLLGIREKFYIASDNYNEVQEKTK